MDSGGYTYVRLKTSNDEVWLAATDLKTKAGDRLTVGLDVPMQNFHSKTLNRDFPLIYFVSRVAREGESLEAPSPRAGMPLGASHGSEMASAAAAGPEAAAKPVAPVEPPPGGVAIADLWARRTALAGKSVVVRGQVVKANNAIMGRNWFHLQDGSGKADDGTNDLTITTEDARDGRRHRHRVRHADRRQGLRRRLRLRRDYRECDDQEIGTVRCELVTL